ncbi:MAG: PIN domain-containing protein [Longimicrobiaceae bacterium]
MGILIDTSVLIAHERGQFDVEARIRETGEDTAYLSVITASELLHGIWRAVDPNIRNRRTAFVEAILRELPVLGIDVAVARIHAQIWAQQQAAGRIIGPHDLWLAATCIAHGFRIATRNVREFARIPGLRVEHW